MENMNRREKCKGLTVVSGGGVIPEEEVPGLKDLGIDEVFGPGTSTDAIVKFVRKKVKRS